MSETADLYLSGLTLKEIGCRLGISIVAVQKRLVKEGVERRRCGQGLKPVSDYAFQLGEGAAVNTDDNLRSRCYNRDLKIVAWRAVFPLTDDERQLVRECLDVDNLTFPDTIEVLEDYRK